MASLHNLIRLVVAVPTINRTDDGELVHHGRLFRKVLANEFARYAGTNRHEGAAIVERSIGLHIPHVDMTRPTGHP